MLHSSWHTSHHCACHCWDQRLWVSGGHSGLGMGALEDDAVAIQRSKGCGGGKLEIAIMC